jgi:hypothetical protein
VSRYNATTGAFDRTIVSGTSGYSVDGMAWDASGNLYLRTSPDPMQQSAIRCYGAASQEAFTVSLVYPSAQPVTVTFSTADGTAKAGTDYVATSGTMTFAPGETTHTILVRTLDDHVSEPAEMFVVTLSNPVGATLARGQGVGTVTDNHPPTVAGTQVNDGSAQRSRVTSLQVTFSTVVTFAAAPAAAFTLTRTSDGAAVTFTAAAATVAGRTVVSLSGFTGAATEFGSLADGRYTLTALASQITANGQGLDGNEDGTPGDDYTFGSAQGLFRYFGDVTGDGVVNGADFALFRTAFGTTAGNPAYLWYLDFDGDGAVNGADFGPFRSRFGTALP